MSHLRWTEYDPYTGVTEINDAYDDDDYVHVRYAQDVQPLLDSTAETRNTRSADDPKKDLHKYASVPVVVQHELLLKGINIFNPDHMPRVLEEINLHYPHLKYTEKTHSLTPKRKAIAQSLSEPPSSPKLENSTQPGPFVIVR
jgi:hypothetical protein